MKIALLLAACGLAAAYFVFSFVLHLYRMKTDPYYRYKARELEEEYQMRKKLEALHNSPNEKVRELAEKLGPRR